MNAHWQEDRLYLLSLFQLLAKRTCYHQRNLGYSIAPDDVPILAEVRLRLFAAETRAGE